MSKQIRSSPQYRSQRAASILAAVVVCLVVSSTIILTIIQSSLSNRRQMRHEIQMLQTQQVLEHSVIRTIEKASQDSEYRGESMTLTPPINEFAETTIEIARRSISDDNDTFEITVTIQGVGAADLPTRRTQNISIPDRSQSPDSGDA